MKLPLWMLALPWVVAVSTDTTCIHRSACSDNGTGYSMCLAVILPPDCGPRQLIHLDYDGNERLSCVDKESCEDMAYALNEAHEKRTRPNPFTVPGIPNDGSTLPVNFQGINYIPCSGAFGTGCQDKKK